MQENADPSEEIISPSLGKHSKPNFFKRNALTTSIGLFFVLGLVIGFVYAMLVVASLKAELGPIPPYEEGRITGAIAGRLITPYLIVGLLSMPVTLLLAANAVLRWVSLRLGILIAIGGFAIPIIFGILIPPPSDADPVATQVLGLFVFSLGVGILICWLCSGYKMEARSYIDHSKVF